jgi:hypothetical protein
MEEQVKESGGSGHQTRGDMKRLKFFPLVLALVACGCGRTGLDGPFGVPTVNVEVAPDASTGSPPGAGGLGGAGNPGSAGRSGTAGATGQGATGTTGGFGGALQFCKTDLDCGPGAPVCCAVGAVMVCEPGPCVTGDEDGDNDHENGHKGR